MAGGIGASLGGVGWKRSVGRRPLDFSGTKFQSWILREPLLEAAWCPWARWDRALLQDPHAFCTTSARAQLNELILFHTHSLRRDCAPAQPSLRPWEWATLADYPPPLHWGCWNQCRNVKKEKQKAKRWKRKFLKKALGFQTRKILNARANVFLGPRMSTYISFSSRRPGLKTGYSLSHLNFLGKKNLKNNKAKHAFIKISSCFFFFSCVLCPGACRKTRLEEIRIILT